MAAAAAAAGCVGPPYCDQAQPGPGYSLDLTCQSSICAADSYCCTSFWDSICASAASINSACANCRSTCVGGGCTLTANAGLNTSICSGENTVLTGSSSGSSPTYSWSPSGSLNNPNISNPTASPSTTTTYTLTVTEGACTATSQVTVTVIPPTSAPTSVTASPATVCTPTTVQLNATSPGNTIFWYTQSTGGTPIGTSASGANFPVNPVMTTTYYAEAAQSIPPGSQTFNYTGTSQTFTVPLGVTSIQVDARGAQGEPELRVPED
ncbi:MAG: hypothetical protein IPM47_21245 [Sphingobacteriales bacterium]|nr:MAG: hypothetical protein IPM47_21245 [Sphingobacteriales bacterium]